ncbi:MAG: hypothetical protein ACRD4L_02380 [Pyrinomonadaceae bacterium]
MLIKQSFPQLFITKRNLLIVLLLSLIATAQVRVKAQKAVSIVPVIAEYEITEERALADGNTLDKKETGRLFRDRQGRQRREDGPLVTISDTVSGITYLFDLNTKEKIARRIDLKKFGQTRGPAGQQRFNASKEIYSSVNGGSLGTQLIDGIEVTGTEYVSVIPADSKFGNREAIRTIFQMWTSEELQLTLLMTEKGPLNGEKSVRYKNIRRVDPDPKLFEVPEGYRIVDFQAAARP